MRATKIALSLAGLLAACGLVYLADLGFGQFRNISEIRENARLFRSEIAPYALHTSALVPNLDHRYRYGSSPRIERLFRTDEYGTILGPNPIAEAENTILFLGGSTTESNEVSEGNRFPAAVETLLREHNKSVRVLNAGVRGHTSQDSIISYLSRPRFKSADIVVLMHNINDRLWLASFEDYSSPPSSAAPNTLSAIGNAFESLAASVWDYISYRSNVAFALRQRITFFNPWTGEPRVEGIVSEQNVDQATNRTVSRIHQFESNLKSFIATVRSQGAIAVLMTQPLGHHSMGQDTFNGAIRKVASTLDVLLIDLDQALEGERSWAFLGDGIHLNNKGSQAVANIIAESLGALFDVRIERSVPDTGVVQLEELLTKCIPGDVDSISPIEPKQILGMPGRYPSFSRDGKWMLFQTWRQGLDRLNAYRVETRDILNLTPDNSSVNERHPALMHAANGQLSVIFGSGFDPDSGGFEQLKIRKWPSLKTEDLPLQPGVGGAIPAVSEDRIVFPGFTKSGPSSVPNLMETALEGGVASKLINTPHEEWRPTLGPDGSIYYISNLQGQFDIYVLPPNSKKQSLVYGSEADEWDPAVSPDGKFLAFASKQSGNWDLYLMDLGTSVVHQLTAGPQQDWDPSFHPSGRLLAFARYSGTEPELFGLCLFGER